MSDNKHDRGNPSRRASYQGSVERISDRAPDVRSLFVRTQGDSLPRYTPGKFISLSIPLDDEMRNRPYTIASNYEDGEPFELVFDRVPGGRGSAWLFGRKIGDKLDFTGPFGLFTLSEPPPSELVFVAEGTSIAPIRPMLHRILRQSLDHPVRLVYGARSWEHLLYRAEFEAWQDKIANFDYEFIVEADRARLYGRLIDKVGTRWVQADAQRERTFYLCGVGQGVIQLRDLLRNSGYERRAVHYERW